jgi:hypothetical protein
VGGEGDFAVNKGTINELAVTFIRPGLQFQPTGHDSLTTARQSTWLQYFQLQKLAFQH